MSEASDELRKLLSHALPIIIATGSLLQVIRSLMPGMRRVVDSTENRLMRWELFPALRRDFTTIPGLVNPNRVALAREHFVTLAESWAGDPEDRKGGKAMVELARNMPSDKDLSELNSWVPTSAAQKRNICLLGGPRSNKLTADFFGYKKDVYEPPDCMLPYYFLLDRNEKEVVARKFKGEWIARRVYRLSIPGQKPLKPGLSDKQVRVKGESKLVPVLKRDYLIVTHMPNRVRRLVGLKGDALVVQGMYGAAMIGMGMAFNNKNLRAIRNGRKGYRYYASLMEVTGINHEGEFSVPSKVEHVETRFFLEEQLKPFHSDGKQ